MLKITIPCLQCNPKGNFFTFDFIPTNDCFREIYCPEGHLISINVLYHEFQLLFEVAINGMVDKYYREAIGSFTASYERFLELFIRIVLVSNKIPTKSVEMSWKLVSKQSERQLGAFIYVYTTHFSTAPKLISSQNTALRNKVVHQGYFPDLQECIKYGTDILEIMRGCIRILFESDKYRDELTRSINDRGKYALGLPTVTLYPYSLVSTNANLSLDNGTIEDFMDSIRRTRELS